MIDFEKKKKEYEFVLEVEKATKDFMFYNVIRQAIIDIMYEFNKFDSKIYMKGSISIIDTKINFYGYYIYI